MARKVYQVAIDGETLGEIRMALQWRIERLALLSANLNDADAKEDAKYLTGICFQAIVDIDTIRDGDGLLRPKRIVPIQKG